MPLKSEKLELVQIKNFIGGEYTLAQSQQTLDNIDPSTGIVYSTLPRSDHRDVEAAVQAARRAFPSWSRTPPEERSAILIRVAEGIERRLSLLAEAESKDQGKPFWLAQTLDIPRSAQNFRFFAGQILFTPTEAHEFSHKAMNLTLRKPVGVAGLISPWNLPLYLLTWKVAPALAAGNTVVCKPSELTPMTAFLLAEILTEAGVPPGVVNLVFGTGAEAGDALVQHPHVPLISFTGGTQTGKQISQAAAPHIKKLSLELGGKNANIIFADAPFEKALATTLRSSFLNQGEICLCGSRIFVEKSLYPEFLKRFVEETRQLKVGPPLIQDSFLGALVSRDHWLKVRSFIDLARKDGGTVETGDEPLSLPESFQGGYYLRPTVITGLPPSCTVMQEEIFGPVVTLTPFETEEQVLSWANGVDYGLSATLWTETLSRAHRFAHALDVGTLWVNTWMMRDLRTPFGGMKKSGLGREGGLHSLDFFTETTNLCLAYGELPFQPPEPTRNPNPTII